MASDEEKAADSVPNGTSPAKDGGGKDEAIPPHAVSQQGSTKQRKTPAESKNLALKRVARSQQRGLFGRFTLVPEVENPYAYSNGTKWMMTAICAVAGATSSTGSSIFYPALTEMAEDLSTTATITNLSLAFYMLAMSFTPLWWSALSETLGRRTVYIISFSLFVVFSVISAVSVNISMLIVFRILSGGAAASVQAVGAGTAADLWEPKERGRAMGLFYIGPICGPGLAPVIGGALTQGFGWRSTLWFLVLFGGALLLLIVFCLPETLSHQKSEGNASAQGVADGKLKKYSILKRLFAPVLILAYLRYPPILVAVYAAAISFGAVFVINISIQTNFATAPYYFSTTSVGLLYLAPTIGYAFSSLLGGRWIDYIMAREAHKAGRYGADGKLKYLPEDRMKENVWLAASLYPAAMIWYGWSVDRGLPWIVSCVANVFFGLGVMLVFGAVTTMLTEFTPKRASTGVAINNFMRNIFSCTGAVVTQPLIETLGTGWTFTMVGLFAWVTTNAAVVAMRTWGPGWRVSMDTKLNGPS